MTSHNDVVDLGAIWVTWVIGIGIWTDGIGNHGSPARTTPINAADPKATLAAGQQTPNQLDVFYPGLAAPYTSHG